MNATSRPRKHLWHLLALAVLAGRLLSFSAQACIPDPPQRTDSTVTGPVGGWTRPLAPTNLSALPDANNPTTQVNLTWTDHSAKESGYRIERSPNGTSGWTLVQTTAAGATTGADATVSPGSTYYYRAIAFITGGSESLPLPGVKVDMPVNPPSGVTVGLGGSDTLNVGWTAVPGATGYKLYHSTSRDDGYSQTGGLIGATSYLDQTLAAGTHYWYKVAAVGAAGDSAYSAPVDGWTLLGAPQGLTASARTSQRLDLNWTDIFNNETGFKLYRAAGGAFSLVATLPPNATSYVDKHLLTGTAYTYRLTATNAGGESAPATAAATTPAPGLMSETWDQVNWPLYPGNSYPADDLDEVAGADNPWLWWTETPGVVGSGLRQFGPGRELGLFTASTDGGHFYLWSSMTPFNFQTADTLTTGFEVKADALGTDDGRLVKIELCDETNYGGGSAVALWLSTQSDAPALQLQTTRQGVTSGAVVTTGSLATVGGAGRYWVSATFTRNGPALDVAYAIYNQANPALPVLHGAGTLDQAPAVNLNQLCLTFEPRALGALDDLELGLGGDPGQNRQLPNNSPATPTGPEAPDSPAAANGGDGKNLETEGNIFPGPFIAGPDFSTDDTDLLSHTVGSLHLDENLKVTLMGGYDTGTGQFLPFTLPDGKSTDDYTFTWSADNTYVSVTGNTTSATIAPLKCNPQGTYGTVNCTITPKQPDQGPSIDARVMLVTVEPALNACFPDISAQWIPQRYDGAKVWGKLRITDTTQKCLDPVNHGNDRHWHLPDGMTPAIDPGTGHELATCDYLVCLDRGASKVFSIALERCGKSKSTKITVDLNCPTPCDGKVTQEPVNLLSGAKLETATDLEIANDGLDFVFARHYDSSDNKRTLLGYNWDSNWGQRLFMQDTDQDLSVDALEKTPADVKKAADWRRPGTDSDGDLIPNAVESKFQFDLKDPSIPRLDSLMMGQSYWGFRSDPQAIHLNASAYSVAQLPATIDPAKTIYRYSGSGSPKPYFAATADPNLAGSYIAPPGEDNDLKVINWNKSADPAKPCTIVLRQPSGKIETYYGFNNPPQLTDGKLLSVEDRWGRKITLHHDQLGRIQYFCLGEDTPANVLKINLEYWDDSANASSEKANLLRKISDFRGRQVLYNYDFKEGETQRSDGNLTSVKTGYRETLQVTGALAPDESGVRETRYEYPPSSAKSGADNHAIHQLRKVYKPREVASNPAAPTAYKDIQYDDEGRVLSENVGGDVHNFYYSSGDPAQDGWVCKTTHTHGDNQATDNYFNGYGHNIKTERYQTGNTNKLTATTTYDEEGRVFQQQDEHGAIGKTETYLALDFATLCATFGCPNTESAQGKFNQVMGRLQRSPLKTNLLCQCADSAVKPVDTQYTYEPVTGAVRTETISVDSTVVAPRTKTMIFDYQEAPFATDQEKEALLNRLATLMGLSLEDYSQADESRKLVLALLKWANLYDPDHPQDPTKNFMGLSDRNGDLRQTPVDEVYGNVIRIEQPVVTLNLMSLQWHLEGSGEAKQTAYRQFQYDASGRHLTRLIDEEGNWTDFEYCSELDNDGPSGCLKHKWVYTVKGGVDPLTIAKWSYTYSWLSQLESVTDPRGVTTQYTYNDFNQVDSVIRDARDIPLPIHLKSYPGHLGETDPNNTGRLSNDPAEYPKQAAFHYTTNLGYDKNGQVAWIEEEDRGPNRIGRELLRTNYKYDIADHLTEVSRDLGNSNTSIKSEQGGGLVSNSAITSYYYDQAGRRVLTVHPAGNADYTAYDEFDHVTYVTRGIQTLRGDERAKIVGLPPGFTIDQSRGGPALTIKYEYNDEGQLKRTFDAGDHNRTLYDFDPFGHLKLLVKQTGDPASATYSATYLEYDPLGNLTSRKSGAFSLDGANMLNDGPYDYARIDTDLTVLSHETFAYDELDRLVQDNRLIKNASIPKSSDSHRVFDLAANTPWQYGGQPDDGGQWLSTRYEYDKLGRLTFAVADDNTVTGYRYNGLGLVASQLRYPARGTENTLSDDTADRIDLTYDLAGNLVERVSTERSTVSGVGDAVQRTTYFYDALGRLSTKLDNSGPDNQGHATDYRYNSRNLLTAIADAQGPNPTVRSFHRRSAPNTTVQANDYGNVQVFYYDGLGKLVQERKILTATHQGDGQHLGEPQIGPALSNILPRPDKNQGGGDGLIDTTYEYDPNGLLFTQTDDNGNVTLWDYDSLDRKKSEWKGLPLTVRQAHQGAPRDDEKSALWFYNNQGLVSEIIKSDGQSSVYVDGDPHSTRPDATHLTYEYTTDNRVSKITATRNDTNNPLLGTTQQTFVYDDLGRCIQSTDNNDPNDLTDDVTVGRLYDGLGRTLEESLTFSDRPTSPYYTATDFSSLSPSRQFYPGGPLTAYLLYDTRGRLQTVADNPGQPPVNPLAKYDYLGERVLRRTLANGVNLDLINGSGTLFDPLGAPTQIAHQKAGQPVAVAGLSYQYDPLGNVAQLNSLVNGGDAQQFTYDSAMRLIGQTRTPGAGSDLTLSQQWSLDGLGNWNSTTFKQGGPDYHTVLRPENTANQYLSEQIDNDPPVALAHDANGNLTQAAGRAFGWDALDRLREVRDSDTGGLKAVYLYDAQGRRVAKRQRAGSQPDLDYVYSGWRVLAEYERPSGEAFALARSYVYGRGLDEPVALQTANGTRYYYHQDALGSVLALSDAATGARAESYEYDPYGAFVRINAQGGRTFQGVSAIDNTILHAGRQWDAEAGLYYSRHRWYDPAQGRFISRDPLEYIDGSNLYAYVYNSPLSYVDPFGLEGEIPQVFMDQLNYQGFKDFSNNIYSLLKDWLTIPDAEKYASLDAYYKQFPRPKRPSDEEICRQLALMMCGGGLGSAEGMGLDAAVEGELGLGAGEVASPKLLPEVPPTKPCLAAEAGAETPNPLTGEGYGVNDSPVRINGIWSERDYLQALSGKTPECLGSPNLHHAEQMPGSGIHEILKKDHGNPALHLNKYNQGVTNPMREIDRKLHWWYRAREAGADQLYPDFIYDN